MEGGDARAVLQDEPVQIEPMKYKLKAPGTNRLKLKYAVLLSSFALNFNLRRYNKAPNNWFGRVTGVLFRIPVGRCGLTLSNPC